METDRILDLIASGKIRERRTLTVREYANLRQPAKPVKKCPKCGKLGAFEDAGLSDSYVHKAVLSPIAIGIIKHCSVRKKNAPQLAKVALVQLRHQKEVRIGGWPYRQSHIPMLTRIANREQ